MAKGKTNSLLDQLGKSMEKKKLPLKKGSE